jgi:hypothetical protein
MPLNKGSALQRTGVAGALANSFDRAFGKPKDLAARAKALDAIADALVVEVNEGVDAGLRAENNLSDVDDVNEAMANLGALNHAAVMRRLSLRF